MLGIFFPTSFSTLVEKETVFPLSWFRKRARKQKPSLQLKLGFQKKKDRHLSASGKVKKNSRLRSIQPSRHVNVVYF